MFATLLKMTMADVGRSGFSFMFARILPLFDRLANSLALDILSEKRAASVPEQTADATMTSATTIPNSNIYFVVYLQ
jgi:hypothetical protein